LETATIEGNQFIPADKLVNGQKKPKKESQRVEEVNPVEESVISIEDLEVGGIGEVGVVPYNINQKIEKGDGG
jgi:hypothetical protein